MKAITNNKDKKKATKKRNPNSTGKGKKKAVIPMSKKLELTKKICEKYSEGTDSIASICDAYGIAYRTFIGWGDTTNRNGSAVVAQLQKEAREASEENFKLVLKNQARKSLIELVKVTTYEEVTTELSVNSKGQDTGTKKVKKVTKTIQPNSTAVIFALKNMDSDNFADKQEIEHSGSINPYSGKTLKELQTIKDSHQQQLLEAKERAKNLRKD